MTYGIEITGNDRIDTATAEIAVALRDGSPGKRDQHYYDEAQRLRDEIMQGAVDDDRRLLELLHEYGAAKFGDEWWPSNAGEWIDQEKGAELATLLDPGFAAYVEANER